jgi:maltose O-acetyltransferase
MSHFKKTFNFIKVASIKDIVSLVLLICNRFLIKLIQFPRVQFYSLLSNCAGYSKNIRANQPILKVGKGVIDLENCTIGFWPSPYFWSTYAHIEARNDTAKIFIGSETCINNNAAIIADKSTIFIGEQVLIGANVFITDSDFHGLEPENRLNGQYYCQPVSINDNVFIGNNVTILKGVSIGANSVISAGAIVSRDVPANVIVGGIPAKVIRHL